MLNYAAKAISSSKHVRAAAFVDQELKFVPEEDYPGVTHLREEINRAFGKSGPSSIPHAEALSKIDDAGKTFRVLFIKTNTTIPCTVCQSAVLGLDAAGPIRVPAELKGKHEKIQ